MTLAIICVVGLVLMLCMVSAFWEEENPRYYEYINRRQRAGKKDKEGSEETPTR